MSTMNDDLARQTAIEATLNYVPKTELGRKFKEYRLKILESGEPLLTLEDLAQEIAERRGGVRD